MGLGRFSKWPMFVLICLTLTDVSVFGQINAFGAAAGRSCEELRREMQLAMQLVFENKAGPKVLKKLIPKWMEISLPANCIQKKTIIGNTEPPITQDNSEFKKIPVPIIVMSVIESLPTDIDYRSSLMDIRPTYKMTSQMTSGQSDTVLGTKQSSIKNGEDVLLRKKRFLGASAAVPDFGAMSMGSPIAGGPRQEVSESAQMMNSLLMFSKLQKSMLSREYSTIGRQGSKYVGDRVSFGSGYYGDVYTGRKKRHALNDIRSLAIPKTNSRRKRFLMTGVEPTEAAVAPTVFGSLFGNVPEPRRPENMAELMRMNYGNTFLTFLPPGMQPPPGKDPLDYIKSMAPLFALPNSSSAGSLKSRNRNGLFGDNLPGRKRRKRSSKFSEKN